MLPSNTTFFKALVLALAAVPTTFAHTLLTNLLVDDVNQGDSTCIRITKVGGESTAPVIKAESLDMTCGLNGQEGVPRVCQVPQSGKLTFLFRLWPDGSRPGSIDISHKGPCAVYMKRMTSITSASGDGPGWFKIWDDGYDEVNKQWCTEKLIKNNGLLSVRVPQDLAGGEYLVRPELLALHVASNPVPEPQWYIGCAQIYLKSNASAVPVDTVAIPGYIKTGDPSTTFNIYHDQKFPYKVPGPAVYESGKSAVTQAVQQTSNVIVPGQLPADAVFAHGNWWTKQVKSYDNAGDCWHSGDECWRALDVCFNTAPPTGFKTCEIWRDHCKAINDNCRTDNPRGPPDAGKILTPAIKQYDNIPAPANDPKPQTGLLLSPKQPENVPSKIPTYTSHTGDLSFTSLASSTSTTSSTRALPKFASLDLASLSSQGVYTTSVETFISTKSSVLTVSTASTSSLPLPASASSTSLTIPTRSTLSTVSTSLASSIKSTLSTVPRPSTTPITLATSTKTPSKTSDNTSSLHSKATTTRLSTTVSPPEPIASTTSVDTSSLGAPESTVTVVVTQLIIPQKATAAPQVVETQTPSSRRRRRSGHSGHLRRMGADW